jgi:hypothetical protein
MKTGVNLSIIENKKDKDLSILMSHIITLDAIRAPVLYRVYAPGLTM